MASPGCLEVLKAAFDWELDLWPQLGIVSHQLYPDWFDSPEGKEGGKAFLEKRLPDFWRIRKRDMETPKGPAEEA